MSTNNSQILSYPHLRLPSPLSNWLRRFLVRNGILKTILLFTLLSMLLSYLVSDFFISLMGSQLDRIGLVITLAVPAIVAPLFSYIHLSMAMELETLREEVRILAITDNLTRAYNRTYLVSIAQQEIDIAHKTGRPLSFVLFDIDNFKKINDANGHLCGDFYLQKISAACRAAIRAQDIFVRYGGEEFVILLPELDRAQATSCAERLREMVASLQIESNDQIITTTISLGVTTLSGKDSDLEDLFRKADRALYMAKEAGKNCVRAF